MSNAQHHEFTGWNVHQPFNWIQATDPVTTDPTMVEDGQWWFKTDDGTLFERVAGAWVLRATFATSGGTYSDEKVMDAMAAAFAAGSHTGLTITYDDALNKFSFAATGSYDDEQARDAIAAMIAAGTHVGVTIVYDDAANTLSFTSTGSYSDEQARDAIGAALVAGAGVTIVVNDAGDTITISATGSYTDEQAQDAIGNNLVDSASIDFTYNDAGGTITADIILEWLQDTVAAMLTGGTHTNLTATYQDASGTVDLAATGGSSFAGNATTFHEVADPATPSANDVVLWAGDYNGVTRIRVKDDVANVLTLNRDLSVIVSNTTGATITKGSAVYVSGQSSGVPLITKARSDVVATMPVFGIVMADIANSGFGRVLTRGLFEGDTSAFSAGAAVYISAATAGLLTSTKPAFPNYVQEVGRVLSVHATTGLILIEGKPIRQRSALTFGIMEGGVPSVESKLGQFVPFDGTTLGWYLFADVVGDLTLDVWKQSFVTGVPTNANSIVAAAKPQLVASQKNSDLTLTGWTTAVTLGDIVMPEIEFAATIQKATFSLIIERSL